MKMVMDKMVMDSINTSIKPLRSRAGGRGRGRAREAFDDPAIANELDAAADYALSQTGGSRRYRNIWRFYCRAIGINTFLDQLYEVLSAYRQGEIREPAKVFHSHIREMKTQIDAAKGGAR